MTSENQSKIPRKSQKIHGSQDNVPDDFIVTENHVVTEQSVIMTREGATQVFLHKPVGSHGRKFPWIVNLHGGGFVLGYQDKDRIFSRKLSCDSGWLVLDIDYSLAPDYPYPVALNQCYNVIKWMYESASSLSVDKDRLVLLGHEAGGNLAALISLLAADRHEFEVKLQILIDPSLDLYSKIDNFKNSQDERLEAGVPVYDLYLDDRGKRKNPYVSPVFATTDMLRGIAPSLIITTSEYFWGDEHEGYIINLVDAGNVVILKHMENSRHGFLVDFIDEYRETFEFITHSLEAVE